MSRPTTITEGEAPQEATITGADFAAMLQDTPLGAFIYAEFIDQDEDGTADTWVLRTTLDPTALSQGQMLVGRLDSDGDFVRVNADGDYVGQVTVDSDLQVDTGAAEAATLEQ